MNLSWTFSSESPASCRESQRAAASQEGTRRKRPSQESVGGRRRTPGISEPSNFALAPHNAVPGCVTRFFTPHSTDSEITQSNWVLALAVNRKWVKRLWRECAGRGWSAALHQIISKKKGWFDLWLTSPHLPLRIWLLCILWRRSISSSPSQNGAGFLQGPWQQWCNMRGPTHVVLGCNWKFAPQLKNFRWSWQKTLLPQVALSNATPLAASCGTLALHCNNVYSATMIVLCTMSRRDKVSDWLVFCIIYSFVDLYKAPVLVRLSYVMHMSIFKFLFLFFVYWESVSSSSGLWIQIHSR